MGLMPSFTVLLRRIYNKGFLAHLPVEGRTPKSNRCCQGRQLRTLNSSKIMKSLTVLTILSVTLVGVSVAGPHHTVWSNISRSVTGGGADDSEGGSVVTQIIRNRLCNENESSSSSITILRDMFGGDGDGDGGSSGSTVGRMFRRVICALSKSGHGTKDSSAEGRGAGKSSGENSGTGDSPAEGSGAGENGEGEPPAEGNGAEELPEEDYEDFGTIAGEGNEVEPF